MAIGDIGSVQATLVFDAATGHASRIIHVSGDVYAICYYGPDQDGWLRTVSIDSAGAMALIHFLEFDADKGLHPDIIHVSGDIFAIAYRGPGDDGFMKTVPIDSLGNIGAVQDTEEFDASFCDNPSLVHVSGNVFAVAYDSDDLVTVSIDGAGAITFIEHFRFDALGFVNIFAHIIHISGEIFAIAYGGADSDGFLKTVHIASDGNIGVVEDTWEFDETMGKYPRMCHVSGDIYALVYTDFGQDGQLLTVDIDSLGNITPTGHTLRFDAIEGTMPDIIPVSEGVFLISYQAEWDDGWLKTYPIASDGTIGAQIDWLEFDTVTVLRVRTLHVSGNIYVITYSHATFGYLKTVDIETLGPAGLGGNPAEVLVKNSLI